MYNLNTGKITYSRLYILRWENRYSLEMDLLPVAADKDHLAHKLFDIPVCNGVIDMGVFISKLKMNDEAKNLQTRAYQNWINLNHRKLPFLSEFNHWENINADERSTLSTESL